MEQVDRQLLENKVSLPLPTVVAMTVRNVRNRLGRSLITLFGVVLGSAFLMAVGTSGLLRGKLANLETLRTDAANAAVNVTGKLGTLDGRTLGVIVTTWDDYTRFFIAQLRRQGDVTLNIFAADGAGATSLTAAAESAEQAAAGAGALVICNHAAAAATPLPANAGAVEEKMVFDLAGVYDAKELAAQGLTYYDTSSESAGMMAMQIGGESEQADAGSGEGARSVWLIAVSLIVSGIGIANALLMSVTERFREIGTLKCLGALDGLVVLLFVIESGVLGLVGAVVGVGAGFAIAAGGNASTYSFHIVWTHMPWQDLGWFALTTLVVGLIVAMMAAIYPAMVAARMTSADAMRTDV